MNLSTLQYLSDQQGHTTGVVVPIDLWRDIQKLLEKFPLPQSVAMPMSQETENPLVEREGLLVIQGTVQADILENAVRQSREERMALLSKWAR